LFPFWRKHRGGAATAAGKFTTPDTTGEVTTLLGGAVLTNAGEFVQKSADGTAFADLYYQPFYRSSILAIGGVSGNAQDGANLADRSGTNYNFMPYIYYSGSLSGTVTGGIQDLMTLGTSSDTAAMGSGLTGLNIAMNGGGAGSTGNRVGETITLNYAGGPDNKKLHIGGMVGGLWSYAYASGNVGGAAGTGNAYGDIWGAVVSATLRSGATHWSQANGLEVDVGVSKGASATYVEGAKVVLQNHNQGVQATDYRLGFTMTANHDETQLGNGISFGSPDGWWPIDPRGSLVTTIAANASLPGGGGPKYAAANGVDFSRVNFSGAAFKSNGFAVDGAGNVKAAGLTAGGCRHQPSGLPQVPHRHA
jgi:hypothetical protein